MIPPFKDHGYLPPGIHPATLEEVEARFGDHLMSLRVKAHWKRRGKNSACWKNVTKRTNTNKVMTRTLAN